MKKRGNIIHYLHSGERKKYTNFIYPSLILYSVLLKISSTVLRVTKTLTRLDQNISLQKSILPALVI